MIKKRILNKSGVTLVEVLIAMSITAFLVGTVSFTLQVCFDAYSNSEVELRAIKFLDEIGSKIAFGDKDVDGVHNAMEILSASKDSIVYVPLWEDLSHEPPYIKEEKFSLDKAYKYGSGRPIGEYLDVSDPKKPFFKSSEVDFFEENKEIIVVYKDVIPRDSKVRIFYWPDASEDSQVAVSIKWDAKAQKLFKTYAGRSKEIKSRGYKNVSLDGCKFKYYDNMNQEILPDTNGRIDEILLNSITAVEIWLAVDMDGLKRQLPVFANLRNTRSTGAPIVLKEGMEILLPKSDEIKIFSIANIMGVESGDRIEFQVTPKDKKEQEWKISLFLDVLEDEPVIESYSVEYPKGIEVYNERVLSSCDLPLDLLEIGEGRYDLDFDGAIDIVQIKSPSVLKVTKMTPKGAALFVRP